MLHFDDFKVYVISGEVNNRLSDIVEVIDLDSNTVGTLPGPGYFSWVQFGCFLFRC